MVAMGAPYPSARCTPYWRRCAGTLVGACNWDWRRRWRRRWLLAAVRLGLADADRRHRRLDLDHGGSTGHVDHDDDGHPRLDAAARRDLGAAAGGLADRAARSRPTGSPRRRAPTAPSSPRPRTRPARRPPSPGWSTATARPPIAEHVPTGIAALAADSTNFYVATYSTVFAYNRASGNQDGQWTMPAVPHGQQLRRRPGRPGRGRTAPSSSR